ncbi:hypothetical protein ACIRPX_07270 [Streptomyces sp. NPDC101225]|uniref:hypothetical protein n=1 Tax=Streptomyces sp. NPDC101225 TaxID=3366135 RepID=UPI00381CD5E1
MSGRRPRNLGVDPATGKVAFAIACPGGFLEALADAHTLESAAVLAAVVGAVLEAGEASDAELASLVTPLHAALDECVGMTAADRE